MLNWQADLLDIACQARDERDVLDGLVACARELGFDYCAYGLRRPLPFTNPKTVLLNNYSTGWQQRYAQAGYVQIDPTVLHGRRSREPFVWTDERFAGAVDFWADARAHGLRVGWGQSSLDGLGVAGMLTLARAHEPLSAQEYAAKRHQMSWLGQMAHIALSRIVLSQPPSANASSLTGREIEVLKWTADGKSSQDIADILLLSRNTIEFHVKNAVAKLETANKTAAVVRAAVMGLLN